MQERKKSLFFINGSLEKREGSNVYIFAVVVTVNAGQSPYRERTDIKQEKCIFIHKNSKKSMKRTGEQRRSSRNSGKKRTFTHIIRKGDFLLLGHKMRKDCFENMIHTRQTECKKKR